MKMNSNIKIHKGFTLIELMIVIAIIGIGLGLALPRYAEMTADSCFVGTANSFVKTAQYARNKAGAIGSSVRIDALNPGTALNQWGAGWDIINVDSGELIERVEASCSSTKVGGTVTSFTYDSEGFVTAGGFIVICDDRVGETGRLITVSATGKPSISTTACT